MARSRGQVTEEATMVVEEKANGSIPEEFEIRFSYLKCSDIFRALEDFAKANKKLPFSIAWHLDDLKRVFKSGAEIYETRYQGLLGEFGSEVQSPIKNGRQKTFNIPNDKFEAFQTAAALLGSTDAAIEQDKIKPLKVSELLKANLEIPSASLDVLRLYELIVE